MGRDNQAKNRQLRRKAAKEARRASYARILIVTEGIQAPIHRNEVMARLKLHIPGYEKGAGGAFNITRDRMATATQRAQILAAKFDAYNDPEPFTALHELVMLLTTLRD